MATSSKIIELRELLAAKFPALPDVGKQCLATGVARIDAALDGGLAGGGMTEIVCPEGGGLLLSAFLRGTLQRRGLMALVDGTDSFDPVGVPKAALCRLLWVHALLGTDSAGVVYPLDTHRPDSFRLDPPDFLHVGDDPATNASREPPARGLPLRRWRPPWPLQVEVDHRCPVRLRSQIVEGHVRAVHGPFQLVGGWWERKSAWACEEWDVELVQGGLYRVSRQGDDWFLEGIYD